MNQLLSQHKFLAMILTMLVLMGMMLALTHFHSEGDHSHECPVCRLVQVITGIVILALTALLTVSLRSQKIFTVFDPRFSSTVLSSSLKDRAPPR